MRKIILISSIVISFAFLISCGSRDQDQKREGAFLVEPINGSTVSSPVKFVMHIEGMEVQPAADGVKEGTGHHHILINQGPMAKDQVVPSDETHVHFGKGQTEASLDLKPGSYQLTLQFANALHQSYGPEWSHTVNITVE